MAKKNPAGAPGAGAEAFHRYAVWLAAATFVLIFVGGLVTSTGSALAVPDWPLSFGKFFPRMHGGVLYEHGHRMVAGVVALMTLGLTLWAWLSHQPRRLRVLSTVALALVLIQAVLGGLTVLFRLPLWLAVSHAGTAQAFFCLTVAIALVSNPRWLELETIKGRGERPRLPLLALLTTLVIYGQILIGAVMRHMGAGLAIPDFPLAFGHLIPVLDSPPVEINFAHRMGALMASGFICWTVLTVQRYYRDQPLLRRPAFGLLGLLVVQIALGATTVLSGRAVLPTTAHVWVGAAVLVTSLGLTMRAYRVVDSGLARAGQAVKERRPGARQVVA